MSIKKLKLTSNKSLFGTTITLQTKDASYAKVVAENLSTPPLTNMSKKFEGGYLFRSPNIPLTEWTPTLKSLATFDGKFNLDISMNTETESTTALLRIEDQSDAALFAWSQVDVWQKWSDALEAEAQTDSKRKPPKINVGKDGSLTATVQVTTLGGHIDK